MNMSRKKQNAATAQSSNTSNVTGSVSSDQAMLTVSARARGSEVITVTADDGNGGRVSGAFTVTVKAVPVVTAISDVTNLAAGEMRDISLSGVSKDPDGDDRWVSQVEMSDPGFVWAWPSADSLTSTVDGSESGSYSYRVRPGQRVVAAGRSRRVRTLPCTPGTATATRSVIPSPSR